MPVNRRHNTGTLLVLAYISAEVVRSLFAEALYVHSPARHPFISFPLIALLMEACKLSAAFFIVLTSTRNFTVKDAQHFIVPSFLYSINNFLYYWILGNSSAGCISLLLHVRLPLTAIAHHFVIQKQGCSRVWTSLGLVFVGVTLAQMDDNFFFMDYRAVVVALIMCCNSALATVINERVLKTLEMPFWDQQLRIYVFGVLASGLGLLSFSQRQGGRGIINVIGPIPQTAVCSAVACIATGALSGILVGFVIYRLDSVVKVVSNAAITVVVTMGAYFFFGIFSFVPNHFLAGSIILFASSYFFASLTLQQRACEEDARLNLKARKHNNEGFLPMLLESSALEKGSTARSKSAERTTNVQGVLGISLAVALAILALWPRGNAFALLPPPRSALSQKSPSTLFAKEKLILITYASSANEAFCRTARSSLVNDIPLYVVGGSQDSLSLVESQEAKPQKYLDTLQKHENSFRPGQILAFIDGFDALVQARTSAIVRKFDAFYAEVVYGAEKNCWPYVRSEVAKAEMCPLFGSNREAERLYGSEQPVRWLNSGIMLCRATSCKSWFEAMSLDHPKHFEKDDQAIAAEACLKRSDLCKVDYSSQIAHNTYLAVDDLSKSSDGRTWENNKTGSKPAFLHFNGDKTPMPGMDPYNSVDTKRYLNKMIAFENDTMAPYREVCSKYDM